MKTIKIVAMAFIGLCSLFTATAQNNNVGIGTTSPDASAVLEIKSTTQGMLAPRMLKAQRLLITGAGGGAPATGLLVYQTDGTSGLYAYNGTAWVNLIELPIGGQNGQTLRIVSGVPTWTFPDAISPSIPNGLIVSNDMPTSLDLDWNPSTDNIHVAGYRVKQNGVILGSVTNTTYPCTGLNSTTSYVFSVQAFDVDGNESAYSNALYLDREAPIAPFIAAAPASATTILVSWSASADDVATIGYEIYQNNVLVTTVTGLSYTATGLTANTSYEYYIKAFDAAGNISGSSNLKYVDREAPIAPFIAAATASATSILVSWSASADDVATIGYEIYQDNALVTTVTGLSYTATGLTANTSYEYYIKAFDAAGNISGSSNLKYVDREAPIIGSTFLQSSSNSGCFLGTYRYTYQAATATDDVGVVLYRLYVNGSLVSSTAYRPSYTTPCISSGTQPTLCVTAQDAAGNVSNCN